MVGYQNTGAAAVAVRADRLRYQIFGAGWAVATLLHLAQSRTFATGLPYVLLTGAALALLRRPASVPRLVLPR